jgi:hypothetical protein
MSCKVKKLRKQHIPEYSLGGWIKDNKQGIIGGLTAAAGIGAMFIPGGQAIGAGLISQGTQGIASEIQNDRATAQGNEAAILAAKQQAAQEATNKLRAGIFASGGIITKDPKTPTKSGKIKDNVDHMTSEELRLELLGLSDYIIANKDNPNVSLDFTRYRYDKVLNALVNKPTLNNKPVDIDGRTYATGGTVPTSYAELESGETFRSPDGNIQHLPQSLPTHNSGGVKMKLPVGTEVLGKMKSHTGKSFKEEGEKIAKEKKRLDKILSNRPTYIAQKSATLMQQKLQGHYDALMLEQESMKGTTQPTPQYQIGGTVGQNGLLETQDDYNTQGLNYFTGGYDNFHPYSNGTLNIPGVYNNRYNVVTNTPYYDAPKKTVQNVNTTKPYVGLLDNMYNPFSTSVNSNQIQNNQVNTPVTDNVKSTKVNTTSQNSIATTPIQNNYTHPLNFVRQSISQTRPKINESLLPKSIPNTIVNAPAVEETIPTNFAGADNPFLSNMKQNLKAAGPALGKAAYGLGVAAPILYNLYQGTLGKTEKTKPVYNPYTGKVKSLMANRRYNINPELEQNRLVQSTYNRNVRNVSPGVGQYLGNLQAGSIGRMRADAQAYATKQNMDNQYMGQEAEMLNNLGQQEAAARYSADEANRMARANKRNFLATGLSQTQQALQAGRLMNNMKYRDMQSVGSINELLSNYTINPDGTVTFKVK